jgi:radical SAM superfamily enzyme YgiQ (UPF0313 family)
MDDLKSVVASRKRLADTELRRYLANKEESGHANRSQILPLHKPSLRRLAANPHVCLAAPSISIPLGMAKRCIPPIGLAMIAGSLEEAGIQVSMVDLVVEGYEQEEMLPDGMLRYGLNARTSAERILDLNPSLIGMSVLFSTDLDNLMELCVEIRRRNSDAILVIGGLHASIYARDVWVRSQEYCLANNLTEPLIDYIVRGEGEHRLVRLIADLCEGIVDVRSDGLVGISAEGFFENYQFGTISNLDALAHPAYHLLPMERYFGINIPFSPVPRGDRVMQVLTSRGCPVSCSFCASTNLYKVYRTRTVSGIIEEVRRWKEIYGIDEVQFADDNLLLDKRRARHLFTEFADLGLPWCTPNGIMVNTLDEDLISLLHASGLYQITLSLDSGNVRTLKEHHHKPVDLSKVPSLAEKCREFGIFVHVTLVVGMPGESMEDVEETFEYVKSLPVCSVSTFMASPIPGSELYHDALERGLIGRRAAEKINTTRAVLWKDPEHAALLERRVREFQKEMGDRLLKDHPEIWRDKYGKFLSKSPDGKSSPLWRLS